MKGGVSRDGCQLNYLRQIPKGKKMLSFVPLQVAPSSSLDPCLSPPDAVATKLRSYVLGEGNQLDGFLSKGELSQAVQLSLSVLQSANGGSDCGQTLEPDTKKLVRQSD